jgi:uncharacterized protein YndB with AHSA1/START domain
VTEVSQEVNAAQRRVGHRVLEAGQARSMTISRVYPAGIEAVWDACTNPARLQRWFLPVSGDLRAGGRFQIEGNAGGRIERCDPPAGFAATWEYGGQQSWIEVRLAEVDGGTRFELDHVVPVDEKWAEFGPGAVGIGWDLTVRGLSNYLAGADDEPTDPLAQMRWMASAEGRAFVALSGRSWCEADIAAGADETEARATAERTTAFYAPPPPSAS